MILSFTQDIEEDLTILLQNSTVYPKLLVTKFLLLQLFSSIVNL